MRFFPRYVVIIFFVVIAVYQPLIAQTSKTPNEAQTGLETTQTENAPAETQTSLSPQKNDGKKINRIEQNNLAAVFKPYRLNYFLPYTHSNQENLNDIVSYKRQKDEAKFQISVISNVFDIEGYRLNLFYTQRAFWQVYDIEHSRPFREVNYNPGAMFATPDYFQMFGGEVHFNIIVDHISNGQVEPYSRSQNRWSVAALLRTKFMYYELRFLNRFPEKRKKFPTDPEGDENPDLYKYQGYNEIYIIYNDYYYVGAFIRGNIAFGHHTFELDIGIPVSGVNPKFHIQYFDGYMESMIDYNRHITKFGIGLLFGI